MNEIRQQSTHIQRDDPEGGPRAFDRGDFPSSRRRGNPPTKPGKRGVEVKRRDKMSKDVGCATPAPPPPPRRRCLTHAEGGRATGVTPTSTYTFGLDMVGILDFIISSPVALRGAALCGALERWAPQTAEVPRLIPPGPIGPRGRES